MVLQGAGLLAVGHGGDEEQQGDEDHDAVDEGGLAQDLALVVAEEGVLGDQGGHDKDHVDQQGDPGGPQALLLLGGDGGQGVVLLGQDLAAELLQVGLHQEVGDDGAQDGDEEGGGGHEEVVAHDLDLITGIDDGHSGLGDAGQQGVQGAHQQVGGEAAGHAAEGGGQTGHGVAPVGPEDHGAQGDQDDVAGVGGDVGHDAQEDHHGSDQGLGGDLHGLLEQGIDHAGLLRHAHAQHGHQHHAQGGVGGEVAHGLGEHIGQAVLGQQADGFHGGHLQLAVRDQLAGGGHAHRRADGRDRHDQQGQHGEQGYRVGQLIARPLDAVEPAVIQADLLQIVFCHLFLSFKDSKIGVFMFSCGAQPWSDTPPPFPAFQACSLSTRLITGSL